MESIDRSGRPVESEGWGGRGAARRGPGLALGLLLLLAACGDGPETPTTPPAPEPELEAATVDVAWISLEPRLPPPTTLDAPEDAGWPEPGQTVRWVAHVINTGDEAMADVPWAWALDGERVDSGTAGIPPGESTLELAVPWSASLDSVTVRLHPDEGAASLGRLTVPARGLSLGLWVEESIWRWMAEPGPPRPFPLWARLEVAVWNRMLGAGRYSVAPEGILDRIRLDRVEVLPDGAPWPGEIDTDLVWYFRRRGDGRFLHLRAGPEVVDDQTIVLHELLHQRGITDIYAYEVQHASANGSLVEILDPDGRPAAGTERMPRVGCCLVYLPPFADVVMGHDYRRPARISSHTAWGLNKLAGRRTPRWTDEHGNAINGWTTLPPGGNRYLLDIPDSLVALVVDSAGGEPLGGVTVDLFRDTAAITYVDRYPAEPQLTVQADAQGRAVLPLELLTTLPDQAVPDSDVAILRVRRGARWAYHFLPVYHLNLAWARGERTRTERTVEVTLR